MRYISRFSETERNTFRSYLLERALIDRERKRLTAIFLSAQHGFSMPELAQRFSVSTNSIQNWFNAYEKGGFEALLDKNMAHHSSHLSQYPAPLILASVESNPQNLRIVIADLAENHQIKSSKQQLQNYLKKKDLAGIEYENR